MRFLGIKENASSKEILEVLDENCKRAAEMRRVVREGVLSSVPRGNDKVIAQDLSVSSRNKTFSSDPKVDINDVNYYFNSVMSYEVDENLPSNLEMFLPNNKSLLLRVAVELLREEKEAFEFVVEYSKEPGVSSEEIKEIENEARLIGKKRKAVLGIMGLKESSNGNTYVKKQGDK